LELKGEVEDIIYQNETNSYTIAIFDTEEEETTIVGYLPFVNSGDTLKVIGRFIEHKEYGRQFKVDTFEKLMPETLGALERYLANGNVKGIGEAIAKRIIKKFGEDTINVFKFEPHRLAEIKGISENKAKEMAESFIENWEVWQIVGFLERFGLGAENAKKVYDLLGVNAIEQIESDPYILIDIARGVDFKQIDQMALNIGINFDNQKRVESGIKYALIKATYNGHSCVIKENLVEFVISLLDVSTETIEDNLINLKAKDEIIIEKREETEWIYLESFYKVEKEIALRLIRLEEAPNMKEIKTVLHIRGKLYDDGVTKLEYEWARALKDEFRFDFLLSQKEGNTWADRFNAFDNKVFYRPEEIKGRVRNKVNKWRYMVRLFRQYEIIHLNTDFFPKIEVLICARIAGVRKIVTHAHNSKSVMPLTGIWKYRLTQNIAREGMWYLST